MALTLGITGMDSRIQADVVTAFKTANAELGGRWTLVTDDNADYVVVDMDSLYGPMSWLRLHAAGRKVIGLTSVEKDQTDFRLMHPVNANDLSVLLSEIASDAGQQPAAVAVMVKPVAVDPVAVPKSAKASPPPEQTRLLPEAKTEPQPVDTPAPAPAPAPAPTYIPDPQPQPVSERSLASWLANNGLERRVRLQRDGGAVLLIDPRSKVYHGPPTLKPVAPCFEGTMLLGDFETPDAAAWEAEAAQLGAAQPLARLQWLGALLAGGGELLPGHDPSGQYRLTKWPQTEREYPKHFRIATAMMKGPSTLDEIATASGVDRGDVVDFVNANLTTGYAELFVPAAPEPETPAKPSGGLFGRMRGR